jgi:hypothetical protein
LKGRFNVLLKKKDLPIHVYLSRLKRRFIFMGILNAIFAPFIVLYVLMYSFFRYFEVGDMFKIVEIRFNSFLFYWAAIS